MHREFKKGGGMIDRPYGGEFSLYRRLQARSSGLVVQGGCQSYTAVPLFSSQLDASSL